MLGLLLACDRPAEPSSARSSATTVAPRRANMPEHDAWCARELDPRFVSRFACEYDSDCLICLCEPIDRGELARRGGSESCVSETREECVVTNALCCDERCVGLP
jgi:hypothetical protein